MLARRVGTGEKAVLARLPAFDARGELRHFYLLLADKNRFALLPEIVRQFRLLELRENGEGLCVFRSESNIYAQIIDDVNGVTLVSANTLEKEFEGATGNCEAAKKVGAVLAERAKEKGIEEVVFDRGGYVYHGRIAALADGAREAGLKF